MFSLLPRIESLTEKKLTGMMLPMTMTENRTTELWKSFMPKRKQIADTVSGDLYSVQVYDSSMDFRNFDPHKTFEKWASVEVTGVGPVPEGMQRLILPSGLYAVFTYKGRSADAEPAFRYFFETWLPGSGYVISDRPHFEILGENYRFEDPESREEIWIPVKPVWLRNQ